MKVSVNRAGAGFILVLLVATGPWSGPAAAETITLTAELSGAAQVPPNPSKGKGTVTASFDTATPTGDGSSDGSPRRYTSPESGARGRGCQFCVRGEAASQLG